MANTYLPIKIHLFFIIPGILFGYFISIKFTSIIFLIYILLAWQFRKYNYRLKNIEDEMNDDFFVSPAAGKIKSVRINNKKEYEVDIRIGLLSGFGIYSPCCSEVEKITSKKHFKYIFHKEIKLMNNKGKRITISFREVTFLNKVQLFVKSGDKMLKGSNIGFFPFGGYVSICFPINYNILLKEGEFITTPPFTKISRETED